MKLRMAFAVIALCSAGAAAKANPPPLGNPVLLKIGFVCEWQHHCMKTQEQAMGRATKYVRKYEPPAWRIQLCNRNASRKRDRVDWIGFNNCIRNPNLQPPPRTARRNRR